MIEFKFEHKWGLEITYVNLIFMENKVYNPKFTKRANMVSLFEGNFSNSTKHPEFSLYHISYLKIQLIIIFKFELFKNHLLLL